MSRCAAPKGLDVVERAVWISGMLSPACLLAHPQQEATLSPPSLEIRSTIHFQDTGSRFLASEIPGEGETAWIEEAPIREKSEGVIAPSEGHPEASLVHSTALTAAEYSLMELFTDF